MSQPVESVERLEGSAPPEEAPLVSVRDLWKSFPVSTGLFEKSAMAVAVGGVSFDVPAGKTLALVGESGSGKTTTARLLLRLLTPDRGSMQFDGVDWLALPGRELNRLRRQIGVVFQDPVTSLDPRMTVEQIVAEPLEIHRIGNARERKERVRELLNQVGLPSSALAKTPREFSGGQRQRIGIARALATEPKFIVLDEPVSALDVSVRAQILNLLLDLQQSTPSHPAYLFIGHDLAVVRRIADRTAVMHRGQIVEEGPTEALFQAPRHPYTSLLLSAQPRWAPR
ncbi:MAG: ATP-binding cassette domain-containing protein [Thermoanaerobaculia bacterium]